MPFCSASSRRAILPTVVRLALPCAFWKSPVSPAQHKTTPIFPTLFAMQLRKPLIHIRARAAALLEDAEDHVTRNAAVHWTISPSRSHIPLRTPISVLRPTAPNACATHRTSLHQPGDLAQELGHNAPRHEVFVAHSTTSAYESCNNGIGSTRWQPCTPKPSTSPPLGARVQAAKHWLAESGKSRTLSDCCR